MDRHGGFVTEASFGFFILMVAVQKPSFSISRTGRAFVAKAALDVLVNGLDLSVGMVTSTCLDS